MNSNIAFSNILLFRSFYRLSRLESSRSVVKSNVVLVDRRSGFIICYTKIYLCVILLLLQTYCFADNRSKILWRLIMDTKWMGEIVFTYNINHEKLLKVIKFKSNIFQFTENFTIIAYCTFYFTISIF